jgi:predicted naringenin-chalcone synthase
LDRPTAFLNAIGTAVPGHDVHQAFINWASAQTGTERDRKLFQRMAAQSGIEHRWSVLPGNGVDGPSPVSPGGFYAGSAEPGTGDRMRVYENEAPRLALEAVEVLSGQETLGPISHLVVASCTGFMATGVDQIIANALGLPGVERTLVGFMGCYAAVAALRTARHIVRSEPSARVLVITVELSSLHLQRDRDVEPLLAMLQFGDGAAAALVTSELSGFSIERAFAVTIPNTTDLIRWTIEDTGFRMQLSGEVPGRIAAALAQPYVRAAVLGDATLADYDSWAVHAGGRSILKAVERGLELDDRALHASHDVLARFGNMSSATLMFVLEGLLPDPARSRGVALAFGPGLAAEGFEFVRCG